MVGTGIRLLVTGANGFVGRPLRAALRNSGIEIHGVSRNRQIHSGDGTYWHTGDLLEPGFIAALVRETRPTHLVHLAWVTTPGVHGSALDNIDWSAATIDLVRRFHEAGGVYALCAGTAAEYGCQYSPLVEEVTPLHPSSIYGKAKYHVSQLLSAYSDRTSLKLCWGRIFYAYGPGEHAQRLVPRVISALACDQPFACSLMTNRRDAVYVEDVATAFAHLLTHSAVGPYNIASGNAIPLRNILDLVGSILGKSDLLLYGAADDPPGEPIEICANISRLRSIGWQPEFSIEKGIKRTIDFHLAQIGTAA